MLKQPGKRARDVAIVTSILLMLGAGLVARNVHVGDKTDQGTVVPTGRSVSPQGTTAILSSPVVDCVLSSDEAKAIVKTSKFVAVISLADGKELASAPLDGGGSLTGIAVSPDGRQVACSNAGSTLALYGLEKGVLSAAGSITLPKAAAGGLPYPCGLQFLDANRLAVIANRDNSVLIVDIKSKSVLQRISVDACPYALQIEDASHLLVSCWAAPSESGRPVADSSGTKVQVDKRGIAVAGSLCRVDLTAGTISERAILPLQPTEILKAKGSIYVACANGDSVAMLDARDLKLVANIGLPGCKGAAPDSLALDPAGKTLFVAFGSLDRIGAYDLEKRRWKGFMRTAWYPTAVRWTSKGLVVGTAKGFGSRSATGSKHAVYDFTATVSYVQRPRFDAKLPSAPLDGLPRAGVAAVPIPERTGEPSLIKHVIYVIKENRTYDQLLGDMREGNGDPSLTIYGEQVTPNHHALARQFVLLDNYYCNGILSADGHAWATEANATTFYEHSHGGWTRSYPFGDDPLATSASGYIWDNALDHGRSVRNFGEFDYASLRSKEDGFGVLARFQAGEREPFDQNIGVERLRRVSERDFPGWNLAIPDVLRADRFTRRLHELERTGDMADLTILYLPQDHTSGGSKGFPSPRAQVADNDLGLGKAIDALSHSKFWASSVVFVEEDDPQDGFDHVDGHRSLCLVASPYVKRGVVLSSFYNQASVIHTIERILGLPPMNQNDAEAAVMSDCFQPTPNLEPYMVVQNHIPLDERTPGKNLSSLDLSGPDKVDDDLLNHRLWSLSGKKAPYPVRVKVGTF